MKSGLCQILLVDSANVVNEDIFLSLCKTHRVPFVPGMYLFICI